MLSATSEYALRALARLAQLSRGDSVLGRDLAQATGVPPKYLAKIMLALRNAGIVMATRGTGGGYMLLRPADAIHLIDIVQVFEGPSLWPHCLLRPQHECSERHPCTAHSSWGKARRVYLELLERTRLCDISAEPAHDTQVTRASRKSEVRATK
jgi:Rrf2 family transcriptional regulator, iron-sulfur cluster assembly transcription factor